MWSSAAIALNGPMKAVLYIKDLIAAFVKIAKIYSDFF